MTRTLEALLRTAAEMWLDENPHIDTHDGCNSAGIAYLIDAERQFFAAVRARRT